MGFAIDLIISSTTVADCALMRRRSWLELKTTSIITLLSFINSPKKAAKRLSDIVEQAQIPADTDGSKRAEYQVKQIKRRPILPRF